MGFINIICFNRKRENSRYVNQDFTAQCVGKGTGTAQSHPSSEKNKDKVKPDLDPVKRTAIGLSQTKNRGNRTQGFRKRSDSDIRVQGPNIRVETTSRAQGTEKSKGRVNMEKSSEQNVDRLAEILLLKENTFISIFKIHS